MRVVDHDYVEEVLERLGRIPADAKPAWGTMNGAQVVTHLARTIQFSMGKLGKVEDGSTWFSRNIIGKLLINGILRMPKNVKVPGQADVAPADLETLHAILEEYIALAQADELVVEPHPFFGPIGVDGWAKLHVVHFEHHMKQFGV
jgi:hydroxymethylglutaryl-CoA reductase